MMMDWQESVHSCSALDIANFLIFMMKDSCDDLTNMKINKLLYYAQGHYLQQHGTTLFPEKIYAWTHGPLIKEVYGEYKRYGDQPISTCDEMKAKSLDDNIKSFLLDIARTYGRFTAAALRNMMHVPNSPWDQTEDEKEMRPELIKNYFNTHEKELKPLSIDFHEDDFIGYHDASGTFVLPKDWHDEAL